MEDQRQDKVDSDIEEIKKAMVKMAEIIQALAAAKEVATPSPEVPETTPTYYRNSKA